MFKVVITNPNHFRSPWVGQFESEAEAQLWLDEQKTKEGRTPEVASYQGPIDISSELELEESKRQAKKFLADTDWYVVRKMEKGIEIPQEISNQRQLCRELL